MGGIPPPTLQWEEAMKIVCYVCHHPIAGKPVRYCNRNFCNDTHKIKWERQQAQQTAKKFTSEEVYTQPFNE